VTRPATTSSSEASPTVSVVTPVFDPDPAHLRACLTSVADQLGVDVEHVLVDDASTSGDVRSILAEAAAAAGGAVVVTRAEQGGIVAATNDALARASGEYVAFVDHDDVLEPDALASMIAALRSADAAVGYSDHDFIRPDGRFVDPCYKPDFSPERLRNQNYITHLVVARRDAVSDSGGLREGFDGAQDHDLILRLGERHTPVVHVPRVLYHWRQAPSSVSGGGPGKPWAFDAGRRAVADHCARIGLEVDVAATDHEGVARVTRRLPDPAPLVSVVIPTRGSSGRVWGMTRAFVVDAVRSIVERSTYPALEFVIVVDDDTPNAVIWTLRDLLGDRVRIVPFAGDFNFSAKMNVGVQAASADLLLLLNDDTELIEPTSIDELVTIVLGPAEGPDGAHGRVAMAGAKLLFGDGTLQHGGHVYHHDLMHACFGWASDATGPSPLRPLAVAREASGVTAAAAVVRRDAYEAVGGFSTDLPLNYNDVDFALKLRADGHRVVWTPHASWYHFESRTRTSVLLPEEYEFVNQRWHYEINNDPYYNPNLAPNRSDWMERPLRSGAPPVETRPNAISRLLDRRRARE
jgi:O-antigen biosynthesis protein